MAPTNIINDYFLDVQTSANRLHEALRLAETAATAPPPPPRRGANRQAPVLQVTAEDPVELEENLRVDINKLLNNPLTKAQPKGHGSIPLKAVHASHVLHKALVKMARLGDETAPAKVDDSEIPADFDSLIGRFVAAIDPVHPFLRPHLEEEKADDTTVAEDGVDEGQQQPPPNKINLVLRPRREKQPNGANLRRSARIIDRDARIAAFERQALVEDPITGTGPEDGQEELEFNTVRDKDFVVTDDEPVAGGSASESEVAEEDGSDEEGEEEENDE